MGKRTDYMREYSREYYKNPANKAKRLEKERQASLKNRKAYQEWKLSLKCQCCPETEACCLEFHHLDPSKKDFTISKYSNKSLKKLKAEAEKCAVLCSNCHKKVHAGIIILPAI